MGPQDDVSDISSSDTEVEEENPKGGEKEAKKRSLNANDVEYEDRDNALTLHLKKCQNEDEKTLAERREKRVTFKPIFNDKGGADKKNHDGNTNTRWEMSENVTTVPLAFTDETYFTSKNKNKKNKKNDDDDDDEEEEQDPMALPTDIPLKIREHWKTVRANKLRDGHNDERRRREQESEVFQKSSAGGAISLGEHVRRDISYTRRIPDISHLTHKENKEDSTLRWRNQKDDELDAILIHALTHIHRTQETA